MADVLLVAATEIELCDRPGLACGVGPVEAAAATARALALDPPGAVLHVGIAGARGITPGGLVIGSESVYCDISAEIPVVDRLAPDPRLLGGRFAKPCPRRSRCRSARARPSGARPTCGSRGWRASPSSVRARSRACRRSRCARSRTRSRRATARAGESRARSRRSPTRSRACSRRLLSSLCAHGARTASGSSVHSRRRSRRPSAPSVSSSRSRSSSTAGTSCGRFRSASSSRPSTS